MCSAGTTASCNLLNNPQLLADRTLIKNVNMQNEFHNQIFNCKVFIASCRLQEYKYIYAN